MTVTEPAWRKRTRPCPFYSQGRCLFADSCNFLHDIKVRVDADLSAPQFTHANPQFDSPLREMSDPPSLVVDTASPRSTDVPSSVYDSSRYSGLLSVLEDVIGPAQSMLGQQVTDTPLRCPNDLSSNVPTASGDSTLVTESDSTLVGQDSDSISSMAFEATFRLDNNETSNVLSIDSTCPSPFPNCEALDHIDPLTSAEANSEVAVDHSPYVVDGSSHVEEPVILHTTEAEESVSLVHNTDDPEDESIMVPNQRHSSIASVISQFSGVSLLASPRDSCWERLSISPSNSPAHACPPDLLSPMQLSVKLRPFTIHSVDSPLRRGDSIDSGYADGDNWVGPLPLSRSPPPRDWESLDAGLSHGSSFTSRATKEPYDVQAIHRSPHSPVMMTIEESTHEGLEESDDTTSLILDAYGNSSDTEDVNSSPTMKVSEAVENEDSDEVEQTPSLSPRSSPVPPISHPLVFERPKSVERLHTEQVGELSCVTDHDASLKTALITQPFLDSSDTSSWLSSHSGTSTPNTSLYSQDNDTWRGDEEDCIPLARLASDMRTLRSEKSPRQEMGRQATDEGMQSSPPLSLSDGDSAERESQSFRQPVEGDTEKSDDVATACTTFTQCHVVETHLGPVDGVQDPEAYNNPVSQEYLASEYQSFSVDGVLQFPLPPTFQLASHSTLTEDTNALYGADLDDVADAQLIPDPKEIYHTRRSRAASDLTVKADSNNSHCPTSPPLTSFIDVDLQRSRAESDLTIKSGSVSCFSHAVWQPFGVMNQITTCESQRLSDLPYGPGECLDDDLHHHHASPPSTYDQRLVSPPQDTEILISASATASTQGSSSHSPISSHSPASPTVTSSLYPPSHTFHSETALRPLLTGRKSLLEVSLFGDRAARSESRLNSPSAPLTRRPLKEVGSTVVPLGPRQRNQFASRFIAPNDDELPSSMSISHSAPPSGGLKPLRLFSFHNSRRLSSLASPSSIIASDIVSSTHNISNASTVPSSNVSSSTSFDRNSPLSSTCYPLIPEHICHTPATSIPNSPASLVAHSTRLSSHFALRRTSRSPSAPVQPSSWRLSKYRAGSRNYTTADHRISRRNSMLCSSSAPCEEEGNDLNRPASAVEGPVHAIATPKPTLLFAIASDDVEQVRQVLDSGEAGPNDPVGPQSALAFTLTNDKLVHKNEIVKTLLAYGADPSVLRDPVLNPAANVEDGHAGPPPETTLQGMDPATRYFVSRADTSHTRQTSRLIYRSFFRPLTRVRYDVVGQDWALEQLFRVLSIHSQRLAVAPIVVLLCGPSGHGKSLLARKFGSLLEVPTHTVNMTTLRSTHDIWQSYSMSPYEEPSSGTLAEFLLENEGKRCVVVLDEIEKTKDQKALWSLLMPWELGRCTLEAGKRHVDVRNVIWLGTSNIGHELVFDHHRDRLEPDMQMAREEYHQLMELLRPRVSDCLGASLLSRVTTVLPFIPFTLEEKKAIAAEAVYSLGGDAARALSPQEVEAVVMQALPDYVAGEGARSLHRAISNQLVDAL